MYFLDVKQHHKPHIHVRYAEDEAIYQIPGGYYWKGRFPQTSTNLFLLGLKFIKLA